MPLHDLDWTQLRTFSAVLEAGSLSGAARALGLTQPTVGRHVDDLEKQLGRSLFLRSPRGLQPTDLALQMANHVSDMARSSAALARAASAESTAEAGTIRLTASEIVGQEILPQVLASFGRKHRNIHIELVLTNLPTDLARNEADIAVRMFRPKQDALVARHIATSRVNLYASQDYVARYGVPSNMHDTVAHTFISYDRNADGLARIAALGIDPGAEFFRLRCDSETAQLALLRAGAGIAGAQRAIASRSKNLVPVLHDQIELPLEVWLTMHEALRDVHRIRLLWNHLIEELSRIYAA